MKTEDIVKDEETAKPRKAAIDPGEELVEVELFEDGDKYKGDVYVSVNGEHIQIRRGEKVMVKRKFADALADAEAQRRRAVRFIKANKR